MGKKEAVITIEKTEVYEQKVQGATVKLNELKKKVKENPPKSVRKSKKLNKQINLAKIMLDKAKDNLDISQLYDRAKLDEYDEYAEAQYALDERLSELESKKNALLKEISSLEDTESKGITRRQRIESNRPDGYKPRERNTDNEKGEHIRKQQLKEELKRIEAKIADEEGRMATNDTTLYNKNKEKKQSFEEELARIEEKYNQALAISKPGLFRRIKNWWQERKNKAAEMLSSTLKEADKSLQRETFLQKNASGISLEEQSEYANMFQQMFRDDTDEYIKPQEHEARNDDEGIDI